MKPTYSVAAVYVLLSGMALAAPQGDPVVSALASCTCNTEIFSLEDLTAAITEAVRRAIIPPTGVKAFPHIFRNGDELHFPWCSGFPEFAEFPLMKPTFSSGAPGAYRVIYDYIGQQICGCVKHLPVSTSDTDFGLCDHEGDAPPSIISRLPPEPEPGVEPPPPLSPDPNNPLDPPSPLGPLPLPLPLPPLVPGP